VAPGYGMVSITLKDGTIVAGNLHKENARQVIIANITSGEKTTYPREKIKEITRPASTMPPVIGILKKSEIRDVIAYLASLKAPKKKPQK
jgi:putative heme-binding domain-containing protein